MFGKWHLGDNYPYRPEDRGFTEVMRHGGGGVRQTPDFWDNAYFDGSYWHNGAPTPVKGFCTDVFFDYGSLTFNGSGWRHMSPTVPRSFVCWAVPILWYLRKKNLGMRMLDGLPPTLKAPIYSLPST
jgi:hypothetical protein